MTGQPLQEQDVFWYDAKHLSCEQQQKLQQMREELQHTDALLPEESGLHTDLTLLRFLKARGWHVHRAIKMYQAMAAWRQEHKVDGVLHEQFPELGLLQQQYPKFYHKVDRFGRPVCIELVGQIDVDALLQVTTIERFLRHHIQACEVFRSLHLPACSAAAGRPILTQTIILDMAGLSPVRHFTLTVQKFLHALSVVDQNNFPEHLGCLFMINTPLLFRSFWSVIKGFLDERTLAKIKVLGTNYRSELLAVIPPHNLPVRFGGTSPCDDLVDVGPWQDPAIIAACPALRKAAAAGLLPGFIAKAAASGSDEGGAAGASTDGGCGDDDGSGGLRRGGSFIGTGCVLPGGSDVGSVSGCSEEGGSSSSSSQGC